MAMTWLHLPTVLGALVSVGLFLAATTGNAAIKDPYRPAEISVVKVKPLTVSKDKTIELTQTACQFIEPEGAYHDFYVTFPRDCPRINRKTRKTRLQAIEPLILKPGTYTFRVKNVNVPYAVGLAIHKKTSTGKKKPLFIGGELLTGYSETFEIELKEGEYVYTGRQNPTFEYPILIRNDS